MCQTRVNGSFRSLIAACLAPAIIATLPSTAIAQSTFIEEIGASERINYSGKLRMLSQRIPAAACYANAGIQTEKSAPMLAAATAEFDLIINGLEFGEDSLGIKGEETDRKVLIDVAKVNEVWDPLHADILQIIDNGNSDDAVRHLADVSAPLLANAKALVSVLVGEYSDPTALLQSDAMTIDIAGRQRMLAQRMSKNVCLASSGVNPDLAKTELAAAREMYQASVNALRYGLPTAGINAPTDAGVVAALDNVLETWDGIQPALDSVMAGETLDDATMGEVFLTMNSLTGQMNTLVGTYNDLSKLGL